MSDIAVLQLETNEKFKPVKFGDSDKARIGDWVIAIGNPFGLGGTVTSGIISARNRSIGLSRYEDYIQKDPAKVIAQSYDLICNGLEMASGSIRIHDRKLQEDVFAVLGYTRDEIGERFAQLLDAFEYGAPPHGGIAPGIDRIIMLLAGEKNIREVTMFPMNQNAQDLMMNAPSEIEDEQLKELNLSLKKKK